MRQTVRSSLAAACGPLTTYLVERIICAEDLMRHSLNSVTECPFDRPMQSLDHPVREDENAAIADGTLETAPEPAAT